MALPLRYQHTKFLISRRHRALHLEEQMAQHRKGKGRIGARSADTPLKRW